MSDMSIQDWNAVFPIGTNIYWDGESRYPPRYCQTTSLAYMGCRPYVYTNNNMGTGFVWLSNVQPVKPHCYDVRITAIVAEIRNRFNGPYCQSAIELKIDCQKLLGIIDQLLSKDCSEHHKSVEERLHSLETKCERL